MTTPALIFKPSPLIATSLATLLAAAPVTLQWGGPHGSAAVKLATAAAKEGSDNSGSGSGSDDGGSDNSGSGSGSDDDGGDSSGSGSGDDDGGDNSGRGGDDNGGRGRGDDDDADDDRQEDRGGHHRGRNGEKIEINGREWEIIFPGGWKEEVEGGIFELKDPSGRTVIERRATRADFARFRALLN